jgi:hypothetical protein
MKEDLEGEIWKDITGYEGIYQISNMGRVYSLPKQWISGKNNIMSHNGKILKTTINPSGYKFVNLLLNSNNKLRYIHQLVAESFLNHKACGYKLVIDHINDDPLDNRLCNLQIVTQRYNAFKTKKPNSTSKYRGVHWSKNCKKWHSQITINKKVKFLGLFDCELKAHLAYKQALKEIQDATL